MKIVDLVCAPGRTGFYFDDQRAIKGGAGHDGMFYTGDPVTQGFRSVRQACSRETAAHHRWKLPYLRRTGGSPLRPLLPDAESQHRKIQQKSQRRFHYENCSYL